MLDRQSPALSVRAGLAQLWPELYPSVTKDNPACDLWIVADLGQSLDERSLEPPLFFSTPPPQISLNTGVL